MFSKDIKTRENIVLDTAFTLKPISYGLIV